MIKTLTYSVEQTIAFEVPATVIRLSIERTRDEGLKNGYNKIAAIKDLREWFFESHGYQLSLRDAKNLIEMEAANAL